MARIARVVAPALPHHITQRGNRRQETFFCAEDYQVYIGLMREWCGKGTRKGDARKGDVASWGSSPSVRCLLVNSVGNVLGLGYHSAISTTAGATASVRRERSGGLGSGTPWAGAAAPLSGKWD
jgi:hypothetical protein